MLDWRDRESGTQMSSFRCECGEKDCMCAISLTEMEHESVRAYVTHFAIARNHERFAAVEHRRQDP